MSIKKIFLLIYIVLFFIFVVYRSKYGIILFGDINFPLQKKNNLINEFYIWKDINFGMPISFPPTIYTLFYKLISYYLPINFVSQFYYWSLYFVFSLSIIYLVKKINSKASLVDYLILIIFSITCPLFYRIAIIGGIEEMFSLVFVNLTIGYLFKCIKKKSIYLKDVFIFFIILLLGNVYLQTMILLFVVLFFYFITNHFIDLISNIKRLIIMSLVWFLLNLFWVILPIYFILSRFNLNDIIIYNVAKEGIPIIYSIAQRNQLFYPFVFDNNLPVIKSMYWGNYYILLIQLFFFCLAIYFNFVLNNIKDNKLIKRIKIFLLGLILTFYIFSLGPKGKWERIFLFFWNYIPVFNSYRSVFKFLFPIYFSLIILNIFTLKYLEKIKIFKYMILLILLPSLIVFFKEPTIQRTKGYKIPQYYQEVETYLKENKRKNFFTKIIPDQSWYSIFNWNKTGMDSINILPFYINNDILYNFAIHYDTNYFSKLNDTLNELLLACDSSQFSYFNLEKLLNFHSVGRIILQKDVSIKLPEHYCLEKPKKIIFLTLEKKFDKIEIYKNNSSNLLPNFYIPHDVLISKEEPNMFPYLISNKELHPRSAIVFTKQNKTSVNINDIKRLNKTNIDNINLQYNKINSVNYSVFIKNVKYPFVLVFNQNFHKDWRLKIFEKSLQNININHFIINGYANGWFIDPKKICSLQNNNICEKNLNGSFNIKLWVEFFPQKILYIGILISITSIIIILILTSKYNLLLFKLR